MVRIRAVVTMAGAWLAVACGDSVDDDEIPGELGNGTFRYECVEPSDPACAGEGTAGDFPDRVGLDGLFDVSFEEFDDVDPGLVRVEPAASEIIEEQNQLFRARQRGTTALLALRARDGRVIDFVHLEVAKVAHIRLEDDSGASPRVSWQTGQEQVLHATALDAARAVLAGAREFEWSISDAGILRLERASPAAAMSILPIAPGTATVSVTTAEAGAELEVTVEGEPIAMRPPDGGAGDAGDAGPEAGARDAGDSGGASPEAGPMPGDGSPGVRDGSVQPTDAGLPDASSRDASTDGSAPAGDGAPP